MADAFSYDWLNEPKDQDMRCIDSALLSQLGAQASATQGRKCTEAVFYGKMDKHTARPESYEFELRELGFEGQGNTGTCWIYAGLYSVRHAVCEKYDLDGSFALSHKYVMFYNKLEQCNTFLEYVLTHMDDFDFGGEQYSREAEYLLSQFGSDAGSMQYLQNICAKYGAVPEEAYPDTFHAKSTRELNATLRLVVSKRASEMLIAYKKMKIQKRIEPSRLVNSKQSALRDLFDVLCTFLGTPPARIDVVAPRRGGGGHAQSANVRFTCTPLEFYTTHCGAPIGALTTMCNDPRHPYMTVIRVRESSNMVSGADNTFYNTSVENMEHAACMLLMGGTPVYIGVDVAFLKVADSAFHLNTHQAACCSNKRVALSWRSITPNHAMVLTGVTLDEQKRPLHWRVRNSWKTAGASQQNVYMSAATFRTCVIFACGSNTTMGLTSAVQFENSEVIQLPPWDVLGNLARFSAPPPSRVSLSRTPRVS